MMASFVPHTCNRPRQCLNWPLLRTIVVVLLMTVAPLQADPPQMPPEAHKVQASELFVEAREALIHAEPGQGRDTLLGIVGIDLEELGQTSEASKTLAAITDDYSRDVYLRSFLTTLLTANDLTEAQRVFQAMKTVGGRAEGLCFLASAEWKAGRRRQAKRALAKTKAIYAHHQHELTYENFLRPFAAAQSDLGDSAGARKTMQAIAKLPPGHVIGDSWEPEGAAVGSKTYKLLLAGRSEASQGRLEIARGDFQNAVTSINSLFPDDSRPTLLYVIATDQSKVGDLSGARNTFALALNAALAMPQNSYREYTLRDIALAQVTAGVVDDSMFTTTKMSDPQLRDQVLHAVSVEQVEKIDFDTGLKTARQIRTTHESDATFVDMAHYFAQRRDLPNLSFAIEQIQCPYMKGVGLREAGEALGNVGYYSKH